MTIRITLDDLTSDQYDALCDEISYLQQLSAEQGQALARACTAREEQRTRAEQAEAAVERALAVLAPYDWPHAQVRAAAVRDALAAQHPNTPTCRPGPYDDCPNCHPAKQRPTL